MLEKLRNALGFFSIPDLTGRVALVTGANSGVGYELTKALVTHGAEVFMACRNKDKAEEAAGQLQSEYPPAAGRLHVVMCDLEDLLSVKDCAHQVMSSGKPLHLLACVAGRYVDTPFKTTADGVEVTYAANFYGHAYLTLLLLQRLMNSGPSRIVNVVSFGEILGKIPFEDLKGSQIGTSGLKAYANSKLMFYTWSQELQMRLARTGHQVDVFCTQPGLVASGLMGKADFRYPTAVTSWISAKAIGLTPAQGSRSTIYAATHPSLVGQGGSYIGPPYATFWLPYIGHTWSFPGWNPQAYSVENRVRLWRGVHQLLQELTGESLPDLETRLTRGGEKAPWGAAAEAAAQASGPSSSGAAVKGMRLDQVAP